MYLIDKTGTRAVCGKCHRAAKRGRRVTAGVCSECRAAKPEPCRWPITVRTLRAEGRLAEIEAWSSPGYFKGATA